MKDKVRKQVHLPPAVCTEEFKNEVQNYASELDRSMSWVIVKALHEYLDNHPLKADEK